MTWSELERLVQEAEADPSLRRSLKHCRSSQEMVLAARRLGYRLSPADLSRARLEDQQERQQERHVQPAAQATPAS